MKNSIIDEAKKDVKANKPAKTIKIKSLVAFMTTVIVSLAIGSFAGITINQAINSNIERQVTAQVEARLKLEK